ncbi:SCO1860 family LAETG-anchored protein [Streptomyces fradiae]|uniref:SCO1860 family LAETG-anchored protein n=1 Tax=Streptomyces fradiae TaxID=1906 RepID=UPI002943A2B0|nr:SCO1860 family LAETG-anchored protein [Streptomyces fradiae]WOI59963.1 SCO1860 family LAETG-anchored protein [Streptomyces fradiae]
MNSTTLRTRAAALAATATAAAALAAGTAPAAHAAPTAAPAAPAAAPAAPEAPTAHAAVLRTGLDVSLLDGGVRLPVNAVLNEVRAPATADRTALTVTLDGVDRGRPVHLLRADVASAKATAAATRAEGSVKLVKARVHLPGLPLLSVVQVDQVSARAVCSAGAPPTAEANLLGSVTVLGKRVTLTPGESSTVSVPGVGEVVLDLSHRTTTSTTAAATALKLRVAVNPLDLNVAKVTGTVALAEAGCSAPEGSSASPVPAAPSASSAPATTAPDPGPSEVTGAPDPSPAGGTAPRTPDANLAETGGDSRLPYVAAGAAALLATGAGALVLARRARASRTGA